jgi:CBS domain-containing protein
MAQTINEVMTHDPRTVPTDAPLTDVAKEMDQADTGAIIVAEDGRFKGIVTDRDIVVRAIAAGKDPKSTTAGEIATMGAQTLTPDASVEDAIQLMRDSAIRRIPVVQDDKAIGIVSLGDLAVEGSGEKALDDISSASPNN